MAKYNAAKHTIESDDGRTLATFTPLVETSKAWEVADWWGGDNEVMEVINEELRISETDKRNVEGRMESAQSALYKAEDKLSEALARIDELEARSKVESPDKVVSDVLAEVAKARRKFPMWPSDPLHAVAIIGEEFGELTQALLQANYEPHRGDDLESIREEAIQLSAMTLRFLYSFEFYRYRPAEQHLQVEEQKHGCAACDRGDYQIGHANECSKKGAPDA